MPISMVTNDDAKTIEIYNAPNLAARNLGDTLQTWMPILTVASLGFAMVGFGAYSTKNKDGENE